MRHINFRRVHHDENVSGVEAVTRVVFVLESTLSPPTPKTTPHLNLITSSQPCSTFACCGSAVRALSEPLEGKSFWPPTSAGNRRPINESLDPSWLSSSPWSTRLTSREYPRLPTDYPFDTAFHKQTNPADASHTIPTNDPLPFSLLLGATGKAKGLAAQARRGILNDICPPRKARLPAAIVVKGFVERSLRRTAPN